jgi:hypothetical protein
MGEGPECCRRAEWPLGRRLERVTALVPLLLTGVRHHPPGRTDKNLCRCFGAPAAGFPDHLITFVSSFLDHLSAFCCARCVRCLPVPTSHENDDLALSLVRAAQ